MRQVTSVEREYHLRPNNRKSIIDTRPKSDNHYVGDPWAISEKMNWDERFLQGHECFVEDECDQCEETDNNRSNYMSGLPGIE